MAMESGVNSIRRMAQMLCVSRSGYYKWRKRHLSRRARDDERLRERIRELFDQEHGRYGAPRLRALLQAEGERISRKRVARLMSEEGLRARAGYRRHRWSTPEETAPAAPNRLAEYQVQAPGEVWVADITRVPTQEGPGYLAALMDAKSRRIVGWALSKRATHQLTLEALHAALKATGRPAQIHHSDRGSQYRTAAYWLAVEAHSMQLSMTLPGRCDQNAQIEAFWNTLKTEAFGRRPPASLAEARLLIDYYIEHYYNCRRLHSALGYKSPLDFEREHAV